MTPKQYLMISALSKQMENAKETAKKEVEKYNIERPNLWACEKKYKSHGDWRCGRRELIGHVPVVKIPQDIAKEVLDFCKELQVMKADEIYAAVLKKLLNEVKKENNGGEK